METWTAAPSYDVSAALIAHHAFVSLQIKKGISRKAKRSVVASGSEDLNGRPSYRLVIDSIHAVLPVS